jgi:hypothetical protein
LSNRWELWRDLAIAFSLANLLLLRAWSALLNPANHYLLGEPPSRRIIAVTLFSVLILTLLLLGIARLVRQLAYSGPLRAVANLAFILACVVALNVMRVQVPALEFDRLHSELGSAGLGLVVIACAIVGSILLRRFGHLGLARGAAWLVVATVPVVSLTMSRGLLLLGQPESVWSSFREKKPPRAKDRTGLPTRVVFVAFDGLDQSLVTDARPRDLSLPNLERLASTAVTWSNAYPPSQSTLVSMPSLITGRAVHRAKGIAANELLLEYDGVPQAEAWSQTPTLFTRAAELGGSTELVGWYHPYCRVIGQTIGTCRSYPYSGTRDETLLDSFRPLASMLVEAVPGAVRLRGGDSDTWGWPSRPVEARWHRRLYREIHAETLRAVADRQLDLLFAHYPVPHEPGIFDRRAGEFTEANTTYIDNLALVDRTLYELRDALASSGLEAKTALLVTADHGYRRPEDGRRALPVVGEPRFRVPLILALPGQTTPIVRDETTLNVIAHDLALAVLAGKLRAPEDVDSVLTRPVSAFGP